MYEEDDAGIEHAPDPKHLFEQSIAYYEQQTWLRCMVQACGPIGGTLDIALSTIASRRTQERVREFLANVTSRLENIEEGTLNKAFLQSDDFFEVFRSCLEAVSRASNESKRKLVADYLAGVAKGGAVTDLSQSIADDLKNLQPLHLQIIANLPDKIGHPVRINNRQDQVSMAMPPEVYNKGLSDLQRLGFLRTAEIRTIEEISGSGPRMETTEYLLAFKQAIRP